MAERTLQAKLKVRSDTATNWQSNNPVLLQGEPAFETDTNKLKFGDGTSAYNDLPYVSSDAVTVEANPTDEATQTLQKLTVGNTTYSIPTGSGGDNGIPSGGLAGQALTKQSGTDYDVAWTTINATEPTVITEEAYAEALEAGTIEDDKLYYIQGTSDNTLNVSQTAQATTYDNTTSGLTATNVQAALDEVKADIPANGDFTLAGLGEKSYNNLTDKPTIPTVDLDSVAAALGLTTTQLNNLVTFAKSITSADTSGTTVNNEFTAQSFDTTA